MTKPSSSEGKPTKSVRQPNNRSGSTTYHPNHVKLTQAPGGKKALSAAKSAPHWFPPNRATAQVKVKLTWLRGSDCTVHIEARGRERVISGCMSVCELIVMINGG